MKKRSRERRRSGPAWSHRPAREEGAVDSASDGAAADRAISRRRRNELSSLEELLDRLAQAGEGEAEVSLGAMLEAVGRRSFGPLLLVAGLIALSPLSGIPGMPTTVAVLVLVVAGQLVLKRKHFWLPRWLLNRKVSQRLLDRALRVMRPPARWIDRYTRPRLQAFTHDAGVYVTAVIALVIALTMPPLEIVPFAATATGAALAAFGLALVLHDGLVAIIAILCTGMAGVLVAQSLL